jgi:hypothetical protein
LDCAQFSPKPAEPKIAEGKFTDDEHRAQISLGFDERVSLFDERTSFAINRLWLTLDMVGAQRARVGVPAQAPVVATHNDRLAQFPYCAHLATRSGYAHDCTWGGGSTGSGALLWRSKSLPREDSVQLWRLCHLNHLRVRSPLISASSSARKPRLKKPRRRID